MRYEVKNVFGLSLLIPLHLAGCSSGGSELTPESNPTLEVGSSKSAAGNAQAEDSAGVLKLDSIPDKSAYEPYAMFSFSDPSATSFECRLDGGYYTSCESPKWVMPLAVGDHTFEVRSLGTVGNVISTAEYGWRIRSIFAGAEPGSQHPDLVQTTVKPSSVEPGSWRGIFRINCDFAHSSYNDPIVFPGQADAAHLHRFYGNTLLDENSTLESLFTTGESTCQGNHLNRSAYWIPALLAPRFDPVTQQRELDANGEPAWQVVPAVVGNDDVAHEVFYYSAGIDDLAAIETIPIGLKMIAGDGTAGPEKQQSTDVVRWHCQSWASSDGDNPRWSTSIPACAAPDRVRLDIFFPSCWNGTDLDSFDHKSHMAYPVNSGGPDGTRCPDTHPVPILRVSFHYAFGVKPDVYDPATRSSIGWRLASDGYDLATAGAGGMSLHGDWINAWHPEALQAVLDTCIKKGLDCHDGNLGNGCQALSQVPKTNRPFTMMGWAGTIIEHRNSIA